VLAAICHLPLLESQRDSILQLRVGAGDYLGSIVQKITNPNGVASALFKWIQPFQGCICFRLSTRRRPIASANTGLNDKTPLGLKILRPLRVLRAKCNYAVGNGLRSENNF